MIRATLILLAFLLAPIPAAIALPLDDPSALGRVLSQVFHAAERSVVQVTAYRPVGPSPQSAEGIGRLCRLEPARRTLRASGVVVDQEGHILTCAEAAQPGDSLEICTSTGQRSPAVFLAQDPVLGITLLRARDPGRFLPVPRGQGALCRPGDWLLVVSFGDLTGKPSLRLGTWDAPPVDAPGAYPFLRLDLADCRGTCGGAVVDGSGTFRGIVISPRVERDVDARPGEPRDEVRIVECEGAWALNRGSLDSLETRLDARSRQGIGFLGVRAEAEDDPPPSDEPSGPAPRSRLRVVRVLPGGPAEAAGVAVDDQILEINGNAVTEVAQVNNLVASLRPGAEVQLKLLRRGAPLNLVATLVDRSVLDWSLREDQLDQLRQKRLQRSMERLQDRLRQLEFNNSRPR